MKLYNNKFNKKLNKFKHFNNNQKILKNKKKNQKKDCNKKKFKMHNY